MNQTSLYLPVTPPQSKWLAFKSLVEYLIPIEKEVEMFFLKGRYILIECVYVPTGESKFIKVTSRKGKTTFSLDGESMSLMGIRDIIIRWFKDESFVMRLLDSSILR